MLRALEQIFALHFGAADRWWAWLTVWAGILSVFYLRVPEAFSYRVFWIEFVLATCAAAGGVWLRRRHQAKMRRAAMVSAGVTQQQADG